ncbi:uncharacterized protein LOC120151429 [Hibiscus syriacus]|uniref:uncharacterized protein LOC120151429 n=1 Tax=Hibiscus syriacus TaxID=106335 RepID=UPI001923DD30|nr:uncharacterized protein LOC120151429 [Hibiscus syriacus]
MESLASALDWRKLFNGTKEHALDFFPPEVLEGTATVKPPSAVFEEGIAEWSCVVVGQFIGSPPNFGSMQRIAEILWGKLSSVKDGSVVMIRVQAPWFPKFCTQCNIFGHQTQSCVENTKAKGKTKDNLIWTRKENSNPGFLEKSDKTVNVVANSAAHCGEVPKLSSSELKVGDAEELSVHALEERIGDTMQVIIEDNTGFSQDLVKVVSDVTGKNLQHSVDQVGEGLSGVAVEKSLPSVDLENTSCGEFHSLQDSLAQKKKTRRKKMINTGSSSKMDSLIEGGVIDGNKKTRATSLGVAMLLNEIKSKKKEHFVKAKEIGNLANNYEFSDGGRLWLLWKRGLPFSVLKGCDQAISIIGDVVGYRMVIIVVYGSNNSLVMRGLWAHLKSLESDVGSSSWVIGGDFNIFSSAQESYDFGGLGMYKNSDIDDFKECLVDLELQDHPYIGPLFTWSNKQENSFLARKLDRVLINPQWLFEFTDSAMEFKAQGVSDHCPGVIWTQKKAQVHKPKSFKFFNCWTANENFLRVVKDSWQEQYGGNTMQLLFNKLKRLKPLLKELNSSYFSDISSIVAIKRAELESIQLFNLVHVDQKRLEEESKLRYDLVALEDAESEFYKQRAKVHWLQEVDLNTRVFHQRVEANKKRNTIKVIKDDGGIYHESFENMAAVLEKFFKDLIRTADSSVKGCSAEWLKSFLTYSLPAGAADVLTAGITNAEIRVALFRQGNNKSPGSDGYTSWFFKAAWEIICNDFFNAVRYFFQTSTLLPAFNVTVLFLAPKSLNACMAKDFRPISYCSVIYKTITIILAFRLALFFPDMISPNQSAFFKGRNIADNTLLAQEIVRGYSRKNLSPRCTIKIDLQKAFDSIWCKGVRQGDPLSPYLFVIVMNVLSALLNTATMNYVFIFHHKCKRIPLTHLCFADDLLLFCHGSLDAILGVISTLEKFYELSGLKLNALKTELFACGVARNELDLIQSATGFRIGQLHVRYLGLPLVTRKLTSKDCSALLVKIKGVMRDIEKICLRFFWKDSDTSARGDRVSCNQGSLWIAWVKTYCFKSVHYREVNSKSHFSWIIYKLIKMREEARRFFSLMANLSQIKGRWIWDNIIEMREKVEWHRLIWFPAHVLKFSMVAWIVLLDRLPTKDRLGHFGIVTDNLCGLCEANQETRNHLFLECSYACEVWRVIMLTCGLHHQMPRCWDDAIR